MLMFVRGKVHCPDVAVVDPNVIDKPDYFFLIL